MMLHNIILELKIVLLKNVQNEKGCDRAPAPSGSARPPALSTFWPFPSRPNRTVVAGEKSQNQIEAVQCKCETRDRLEMWTLRLVTFFVDEHKIDDRRPCDPGLDGQRFKVALRSDTMPNHTSQVCENASCHQAVLPLRQVLVHSAHGLHPLSPDFN